ncbi:MAG: hypothetical protein RPV21_16680 [Candidatus Sedimenticola sp. (ex Thyasira tokunagai)]
MSCGISCIAMLMNRVQNTRPTERAIIGLSMVSDGDKYVPTKKDSVTKQEPTRWTGTGADNVSSVLQSIQIPNKVVSNPFGMTTKKALGAASYDKPVIILFRDEVDAGGHFVVCDGPRQNGAVGQYVYCDPQSGKAEYLALDEYLIALIRRLIIPT